MVSRKARTQGESLNAQEQGRYRLDIRKDFLGWRFAENYLQKELVRLCSERSLNKSVDKSVGNG